MPWTEELWQQELYKNGIQSDKMDVIFGEPKAYKNPNTID